MAWQLFRLGRYSFRHRKLVAGIWVALLVVLGVGAATLSAPTNDNFELSGIESTEAFQLIEERSPEASPDGATARVVFEAPEGQSLTDPANSAAVAAAVEQLRSADVASVDDPFTAGTVSENGRVGYASVAYTQTVVDLAESDKQSLERAAEVAEDAGLAVLPGQVGQAGDGRVVPDRGVGPVMVVLVQPGREGLSAS